MEKEASLLVFPNIVHCPPLQFQQASNLQLFSQSALFFKVRELRPQALTPQAHPASQFGQLEACVSQKETQPHLAPGQIKLMQMTK